MQWTTTGDRITLPYVAPEDDLQSTPATIKALAEAVVAELEAGSGSPIGAMMAYAGVTAPVGWLICDGQEHATADYPLLSAALNGAYGTASADHFRVPNLLGRTLVAAGNDGTAERVAGQLPGAATSTLDLTQIPSHDHSASATCSDTSLNHTHDSPNGQRYATHVDGQGASGLGAAKVDNAAGTTGWVSGTDLSHAHTIDVTVAANGGSAGVTQPHDIIQPSAVVTYYIIKHD